MKWKSESGNTYLKFIFNNSLLVFGLLILFIVLLAVFFSNNPQVVKTDNGYELAKGNLLSQYGLLGIFIGELVANATILFPMPFDAVVLLAGAAPPVLGLGRNLFSIILIGLFAGLGSALGECTAYVMGATGFDSISRLSKKNFKILWQFRDRISSSGPIVIFLAALVPFPFDVVGLAAGMMKYDFILFFSAAFAGKTVRCILIALAGYYGLQLLSSFFLAAA